MIKHLSMTIYELICVPFQNLQDCDDSHDLKLSESNFTKTSYDFNLNFQFIYMFPMEVIMTYIFIRPVVQID